LDNDVGSNWERGVPTPGAANLGMRIFVCFVQRVELNELRPSTAIALPAGTRPPRIGDAIHILDYTNKKGFLVLCCRFVLSDRNWCFVVQRGLR
jgi:hypothetical protein